MNALLFDSVTAATEELIQEVSELHYQIFNLESRFKTAEDCHTVLDAAGRSIYYEMDA